MEIRQKSAALVVLTAATTIGHFVIMLVFPRLLRQLPRPRRTATELRIRYENGRGLLRTILLTCTSLQFADDRVSLEKTGASSARPDEATDLADDEGVEIELRGQQPVTLVMQVKGKRPVSDLIAGLGDIGGIREVGTVDDDLALE